MLLTVYLTQDNHTLHPHILSLLPLSAQELPFPPMMRTDSDCQKFEVLGNVTLNNEQSVAVTSNSGLKTINIDDFSALYIKHQSVAFPTNSLVAICGVSGSGKSTFVNHCLIPWLTSNAKELGIKRIDNLGQKNATRTVTSNVGSLLGINDKIAQLFVKKSGLGKGNFLINSSEGKCSLCGGSFLH